MTLTASDALVLLSSEPRLQYEQKPLRRFGASLRSRDGARLLKHRSTEHTGRLRQRT